jgi:hypothetical protein
MGSFRVSCCNILEELWIELEPRRDVSRGNLSGSVQNLCWEKLGHTIRP